MADMFWEKGKQLGAHTWLGTSMNEVDVARHQCAIIGRMLGHHSSIQELERLEPPELSDPPTSDELYDLMVHSRSLSNWAFVARNAVKLTEDEKKKIWNLDCRGKMGIPKNLYERPNQASALFEIEGTDLRVLGNIEIGFFDQLLAVISANPGLKRVVLGSGGGNVIDAIKGGLIIRKMGLTTTLSSSCYSACTLLFLGGVERTIWSPYPTLGFHQASRGSGQPIDRNDKIYSMIYQYSAEMGASPDFVYMSMMRALPQEMYEPELKDLCKNWVVTWVQRACSGGDPY